MRRIISLLLLVVFYTLLTAVSAEVGVRLGRAAPPPEASGWFWRVPDPVTGWSHIPNSVGRAFNPLYEYDAQVAFNSRGIRGPESLGYAAAEDVYRVLLLGDSFVEAVQVNDGETLGEQLRILLEEGLGQPVEVVNAGVSGFGTDQQLLWLREEGVKYAPDLVLLAVYPHNDFMNNAEALESANQGAISKPFFALVDGELQLRYYPFDPATAPEVTSPFVEVAPPDIPLGPLTGVADWLRPRSALFRYFDPRIRLASPRFAAWLARTGLLAPGQESQLVAQSEGYIPLTYRVYTKPLAAEWQDAVALTTALFGEIEQTARQMGAASAALLIPSPESIDSERWQRILTQFPAMQSGVWEREQPEQLALAGLEQAGIPATSLTDAFRKNFAVGPPLYLAEDSHWTATGHALAARATVNFLGESEIIPALAGHALRLTVVKPPRTAWEWAVLLIVLLLVVSIVWNIVQTGPVRWLRQVGAGLSTTVELFGYVARQRQFVLLPLLVILLAFAGLLILAQASVVGPFIYTLI
ncbi:MAG: SGNH/GDSL hydrolase family protein [Chloroflexi bacterium]|nr:SGNH/GDSL hydrolase family protein [Chloroflexota bacterium]